MDSLTQLVLGAAVGEAVLGKKIGNKAILWGAIAGTLPDMDILFNPLMSEINQLAFHRGVSHALFWQIVFAPIVAFLVHRFWFSITTTVKDWIVLFGLGFTTHTLLDAFTTYGTQLFLPFSSTRVYWSTIFVADPLYTIPFLICLIAASLYARSSIKRRFWNYLGLGLSSVYLLFTVVTKNVVGQVFVKSLTQQDITYNRITTAPTPLNTILWYAVAETDKGYYFGLYSIFDSTKEVYFKYDDHQKHLIEPWKDKKTIQTLQWFSDNFYLVREREEGGLYFYDVRFGEISGNTSDEPQFPFGFVLEEQTNEELSFEMFRGAQNMQGSMKENATQILGFIWTRLKGI